MERLTKDGMFYELVDDVQIAAFKAAGWTEAATAEKPKRTAIRKTQDKAEKQD